METITEIGKYAWAVAFSLTGILAVAACVGFGAFLVREAYTLFKEAQRTRKAIAELLKEPPRK